MPKSGTHALVKAVELLGIPWMQEGGAKEYCIHGHYEIDQPMPRGKQILIIRNPRDMLVSWVRWTKSSVTEGYLISATKSYYSGKSFRDEARNYIDWFNDDETFVVKFESLISEPETLQQIARFINAPYIDGAFENIPGLTKTWTGKLSNWRDHWSSAVEQAWVDSGGLEIERGWGYAISG